MKTVNPFPLRIEEELMEKLRIIADENSRSVNKEIEYLIKKEVKEYEKSNSIIELDFSENKKVANPN